MALSREELDQIKARANEGVLGGWQSVDPAAYPPPMDPALSLIGQLKRDNLLLTNEIERLWAEHGEPAG